MASARFLRSLPLGWTPPLPGGEAIAALERVELGGRRQAIVLRGRSRRSPPLLFLAGGPGGSEIGWLRHWNSELERGFVVVHWDQRGAGKSLRAGRPRAELSVARYVADTLELARLLKRRFGRRVVLVGHSWGALLGALAARGRSDLFAAYVGVAQVVDVRSEDRLMYDFALARARERGERRIERRLERAGAPPYAGRGAARAQLGLMLAEQRLNDYPDNEFRRRAGHDMLCCSEYTPLDLARMPIGILVGTRRVYPQLHSIDLRRDVPALELPVWIVHGRYDRTCSPELVEAWLAGLAAPSKRLLRFERSGHSPLFEEPARFNELLLGEVLSAVRA